MTTLFREKPVTLRSSLASSRRHKIGRWPLVAGLALFGVLHVMAQPADSPVKTLAAAGIKPAKAAVAAPLRADCRASPAPLQQELSMIAQGFDGAVGIAVSKAGCDWVVGERLDQFFPQQSVSKLWVSLAVLDAFDRGKIGLDDPLAIRPQDLTLFNQPLRAEVLEKGVAVRSVRALMFDALTRSDNTANDKLLWTVGGPGTVGATIRAKGLEGIRFGPGERLMQSKVAGLAWSQDLSIGRNFEQARARLPLPVRQAALDGYVADPIDGAKPKGMARALARLAGGELLSPQSTAVMMDILSKTHSGPRRLKAGAPEGWRVYHKTGTGQELGRVATGYNDVGILETPGGARYAVAVMVAHTTQPIPVRMEMMQEVSRAVGRFDSAASQ